MNKKNQRIIYLCAAGVFAALVFITTGVLTVHIPLPGGGYAHLGDTFVLLAATCLPQPFALAAAGIGAAAADVFVGYYAYAPFTLVIKAVITLLFTAKKAKIICLRNIVAIGGALVITAAAYYGAEVLMYGSAAAPLVNIPGNAMQVAADGILFIIIAAALDEAGLRKKLLHK